MTYVGTVTLINRLDSFSASVLREESVPPFFCGAFEEHPEIQGLCRHRRCSNDQWLLNWDQDYFCFLVLRMEDLGPGMHWEN